MKRADWKKKSDRFSASAQILLQNGEFASAYYLAGLSIECALKAKIARRFKASVIPEKQLVNSTYDHDLEKLVSIAQLKPDLDSECGLRPALNANWQTARQWKIDARYGDWSQAEANDMVRAVTAKRDGILVWIKRNW